MNQSPANVRRDRPVRVLWLIKGLGRGGAERLLTLMGPRIDPARVEIEVAYLLPWKDAFVSRLMDAGLSVHCLRGGGRLPFWMWRLRRLLQTGHYDIVHSHSPVAGSIARLIGGAPTFMHTEHNVWGRYRLPTFLLNAATFGRNAKVIAVSEEVAASIRQPEYLGWVKTPSAEVVLHGMDEQAVRRGPEAKTAARVELGVPAEALVLGTVANFVPKKDHANLLVACSRLVHNFPDLRIVLVGTGPLEGAIRERAKSLGLADRVVFAGSRDDVQELLPAFDVFVLPSRHEGLPIALLEAMGAGIPCVATDVGGVRQALHDGEEGFLVPPADSAALASAVEKLLRDGALRSRLGRIAEVTAAGFSISKASSHLQDCYEALVRAA